MVLVSEAPALVSDGEDSKDEAPGPFCFVGGPGGEVLEGGEEGDELGVVSGEEG